MLKSYLRIALRNLIKEKLYTTVNIIGLAIGLAGCLLILCYIFNELSYENNHKNKDKIYRVAGELDLGAYQIPMAGMPVPLKSAIEQEIADVDKITCFKNEMGADIRSGQLTVTDNRIIYADPQFLEIFTVPLSSGARNSQLAEPFTAMISQPLAEKIFGDENPIGQTVTVDKDVDLQITGVFAEIPSNTQIRADLLASFSTLTGTQPELNDWGFTSDTYVYLMLNERGAWEKVEGMLPAVISNHASADIAEVMKTFLQPLGDIYLHSNLSSELPPRGNLENIYLFSVIAALILLIACANFINLSTAKTSHRLKEIGIRKVMGADRSHLIRQFLGESIIMTMLAMILGLVLFEFTKPILSNYVGKTIETGISNNLYLQVSVIALVVIVGIFSGFYPALYLSKSSVVKILKGHTAARTSKSILRRVLVVFQFTAAIGLIFISLSIHKMVGYLNNTDLGYTQDNIILLDLNDDIQNRAEKCNLLKGELAKIPEVETAMAHQNSLGRGELYYNMMHIETGEEKPPDVMFHVCAADYDFIDCYDLQLIEGRKYSPEFESDVKQGIIINETAVKQLGLENPIGRKIISGRGDQYVVGVLKDFHNTSLRNKIMPFGYILNPDNYKSLAVKLPAQNSEAARAKIETVWNNLVPEQPFGFTYLTDETADEYASEKRTGILFLVFTLIALLIACLGAFGLASFAAEQRTHEIGIRKVLGASVANIVNLTSREFLALVAAACLIAWPLAWYLVNKGLQEFPYRPSIGVDTFVVSGIICLVIALLTVGYQSLRAALADPIDTLKHE